MMFEISKETWKRLAPLHSQLGFQELMSALKRHLLELQSNSLPFLEGNQLYRTQGEAQFLKQLVEAIENESASTGDENKGETV